MHTTDSGEKLFVNDISRYLNICHHKVLKCQCIVWFFPNLPPFRSEDRPCRTERFFIGHQQQKHQAHSRRGPLSAESHHETRLWAGEGPIFPYLALIIRRRIARRLTPPLWHFEHLSERQTSTNILQIEDSIQQIWGTSVGNVTKP